MPFKLVIPVVRSSAMTGARSAVVRFAHHAESTRDEALALTSQDTPAIFDLFTPAVAAATADPSDPDAASDGPGAGGTADSDGDEGHERSASDGAHRIGSVSPDDDPPHGGQAA